MADDPAEKGRPHIIFEETEAGLLLKLGRWQDVIEEGYSSFEAIRKTVQTSDDIVPDKIVTDENEEIDESFIVVKNPAPPVSTAPALVTWSRTPEFLIMS